MKFRGHETFYIRKGWITKGLKRIIKQPNVFSDKNTNQMDEFGIGANMVKSLRYWMQATGIAEEMYDNKVKVQIPTSFGKLVQKHDKYFEEQGTLLITHYKLAKNKDIATSWYHFFSSFNLSQFNKGDFKEDIKSYLRDQNESVADRSLDDDFACIINTYVSKRVTNPTKIDPENILDCPLGELNLISLVDKKKRLYKKNVLSVGVIPVYIFLAVIIDQGGSSDEINISSLLEAECNVGKVFNLDSTTLMQNLEVLKNKGLIELIRTAGLDVIKIKEKITFEQCIERYYESLQLGD